MNRCSSVLAAPVVLVLAAVASCHDLPTSVKSRLTPDALPSQTSLLGSGSIPVPPTNGQNDGLGGAPSTFTGVHVPAYTSFVVKVAGRINVTRNPRFVTCYAKPWTDWSAEGSYGPLGTGSALGVSVSMHNANNTQVGVGFSGTAGRTGPDSVASDTLFTWVDTDIWAGRGLIWTHTAGSECNMEDVGQWLMSGTQQISVEEITGDVLTLRASPTKGPPGTAVTFTPGLASGQTLTTNVNWRWTPDSGSATTPCGASSTPCALVVTSTGTMRIAAYVAGRMRQAKARVLIYTTFELQVDKPLASPGDTAAFTPKLDGKPVTIPRWKWVPDDSVQMDSTNCQDTEVCKKEMVTSGTMWAYLGLDESADSASRHVSVTIPDLALSTDRSEITDGDTVHLVGSASIVRLANIRWTFSADTTVENLACESDQCSFAPHTSGVVRLTASVAGQQDTASAFLMVRSSCSASASVQGPTTTRMEPRNGKASRSGVARDVQCSGGEILGIPDVGDETEPTDSQMMTSETQVADPDTCYRDASESEGSRMATFAMNSPDWTYTQGGFQYRDVPDSLKGTSNNDVDKYYEPPKNWTKFFGDCTDFVWWVASKTLGTLWNHPFDYRPGTGNFRDTTGANTASLPRNALRRVGYRRVPRDSTRVGDTVIRGGHAAIVTFLAATGKVIGYANNGAPARPPTTTDSIPRFHAQDKPTGIFDFSTKDNVVPQFARPLIRTCSN